MRRALQSPGRWGNRNLRGYGDMPARSTSVLVVEDEVLISQLIAGLVRKRLCRAHGGGRRGGPTLSRVGGEGGRAVHRHQSRRTHGWLDAGARGARAAPRIADRLLFRALFARRAGAAGVALDLPKEALSPGRF